MIVSCNNPSLLSIFSISFVAHAPEVFKEHAHAVVLRRENRNITSCERCLSIYACFEGLLETLHFLLVTVIPLCGTGLDIACSSANIEVDHPCPSLLIV